MLAATPGSRLPILRCAYLAAALACAVMGWLMAEQAVFPLVLGTARMASGDPMFRIVINIIWFCQLAFIAVLFAVMLFLLVRPWWWGKPLCALVAVSWLGFFAMAAGRYGLLSTIQLILAAGVTMACTAVVHQVIDPRFAGTPLRA
jgi:hypothetical protein